MVLSEYSQVLLTKFSPSGWHYEVHVLQQKASVLPPPQTCTLSGDVERALNNAYTGFYGEDSMTALLYLFLVFIIMSFQYIFNFSFFWQSALMLLCFYRDKISLFYSAEATLSLLPFLHLAELPHFSRIIPNTQRINCFS